MAGIKNFFTKRSLEQKVALINDLEDEFKACTNSALQAKVMYLKQLLQESQPQQDLMLTAFALGREASRRVLGIRHFDVQLFGGLALNGNRIAEMKTGEGKTVVAILPALFNALLGESVHVITVNEYLARRDSEYTGKVHSFLGLSVGLLHERMGLAERKKNYNCDILYATDSEIGFDFLRDNTVRDLSEVVQRPLYYSVLDEVDSILIDKASTPLILSGYTSADANNEADVYCNTSAQIAKGLIRDFHYRVDEKSRSVSLTDSGEQLCEKILDLEDIFDVSSQWAYYVKNALIAKEIFQKDREYLIATDDEGQREIIIIDDSTGRIMEGQRWKGGIHQAIEAKHNLRVRSDASTLASISYQSLFLLYPKMAGMTGTAQTEREEFKDVYGLDVVTVPTNKLFKRKDLPTTLYLTGYAKWRRIAEESFTYKKLGRPVLIGTRTIKGSEIIASMIGVDDTQDKEDDDVYSYLNFKGRFRKPPYQLLNARPENSCKESAIIGNAGLLGAITIATNMAGRGTDILLGGSPTQTTEKLLSFAKSDYVNSQNYKLNFSSFLSLPNRGNKILSEVADQIYGDMNAREVVCRWTKALSLIERSTPLLASGLIVSLYYWSLASSYPKEKKNLGIYRFYLKKTLSNLMSQESPVLASNKKQKNPVSFCRPSSSAWDKFWLENALTTLSIQELKSPIVSPWFLHCFQEFFTTRDLSRNFENTEEKKASKVYDVLYDFIYRDQKILIEYDRNKLTNLGGLHVIGTELNYSRRVDEQLRGRAGRQGEPGSSQFFISTEDDALRNFGGKKLGGRLSQLQLEGSNSKSFREVPLRLPFQSQLLGSVQETIESISSSGRRTLLEYDQFVTFQRNYIYDERFKVLKGNAKVLHKSFLLASVHSQLKLSNIIGQLYNPRAEKSLEQIRPIQVKGVPYFETEQVYFGVEREFYPSQQFLEIEFSEQLASVSSAGLYALMIKNILLDIIDKNWRVQLEVLSELRESTKWLGYGRQNALTIYARQSLYEFSKMLTQIREEVVMETSSSFQRLI